jgi:hypothetical protein
VWAKNHTSTADIRAQHRLAMGTALITIGGTRCSMAKTGVIEGLYAAPAE